MGRYDETLHLLQGQRALAESIIAIQQPRACCVAAGADLPRSRLRARTAAEFERVQETIDKLRMAIELQLASAPFNCRKAGSDGAALRFKSAGG